MVSSYTSAVDAATIRVTLALGKPARRRRRDLVSRAAYYDAIAAMYDLPDRDFYRAPPPLIDPTETPLAALPDGGRAVDLSWRSAYEPVLPLGRAELRRWPECATAHARLFLHPRPSPAIICIHGFRSGNLRVEQSVWRARWLYDRGLDVALFTLPHHGRRACWPPRRVAPFPSQGNTVRTNEGFGQAICDLRQLRDYLEAAGGGPVGAAGMSLGGYVAALWATVDPQLAFAALLIPLADLTHAVVQVEARRGVVVPPDAAEASQRAMRIHRPLARQPVIEPRRVAVFMAEGDLITGPPHSRALATHFGAELIAAPGGHLVQLWRPSAFASMLERLEQLGVLPPPV